MNKTLAMLMAALAIGPAAASTSVGVSIGINQPGVYGRIDIGNVMQPALVYMQPMIISPPAVYMERIPAYLYVPPMHQQDWRHYCGRYNACGQPVYFVRDDWVRERYEQSHPGWDRGDDDHGNGHGHKQGKEHGHSKDSHKD